MPTFRIKIEFQVADLIGVESCDNFISKKYYRFIERDFSAHTSELALACVLSALLKTFSDSDEYLKIDNIYIQEI